MFKYHGTRICVDIFVFTFRQYLQINENTAKMIWHPSIKFENLLKYEQTKSFGDHIQNNFWIYGNESLNLEYSEEFQITLPCRFHLSNFPFDYHECFIYFGDERYTTDELKIEDVTLTDWSNKSIGFSYYEGSFPLILEDLALPYGLKVKVLPIREIFVGYNVSQAGILITIKRNSLGLLLSGYYYPTASFALLSMVSFLINPDVV